MYRNSVTRLVLLTGITVVCLVGAFVVTQAATYGSKPQSALRNPQSAIGQAPPIYLGIESYRHWDKLSYLEVGTGCGGSLQPTLGEATR